MVKKVEDKELFWFRLGLGLLLGLLLGVASLTYFVPDYQVVKFTPPTPTVSTFMNIDGEETLEVRTEHVQRICLEGECAPTAVFKDFLKRYHVAVTRQYTWSSQDGSTWTVTTGASAACDYGIINSNGECYTSATPAKEGREAK